MKKSLFFALVGALILFVGATVVTSFSRAQQSENTHTLTAVYAHGVLRVSIPFDAPRPGEGDLVVELLDPEDASVAHIDRQTFIARGPGIWQQLLTPPKSLTLEDLAWHRLRYRFTYRNETAAEMQGIASVSRILRRPVVHVLDQPSYLSGSVAAVRLILTEADSDAAVTSGTVQIALLDPSKAPKVLYTGSLNGRGTSQVHFHFPAALVGNYSLRYSLDTSLGPVEYTRAVRLEEKSAILLTTEKPIYQPGQTIHIRALALDRSNHQAVAERKLTFELEDSRGNKVFRKIIQTDSYGVASAEFGLADEVNLGTYHLRALLGDTVEAAPNKTEIALEVDRYVLPRFKVAVELAGSGARAKRGYRPGDHVTGTVRANYFFGKPVDGEVAVRASGMDVERFDAGSSQGRTNSDGTFRFDIRLPDFVAGRPLNHGVARVLVEATVKDAAGHSESHAEPVTVCESPLLITVVPESGAFIPGLENQLFVLTSYPDGTPAETDIRVQAAGNVLQTATTDRGGIAIVPLRAAGVATLNVRARDHEGNRASIRFPIELRPGPDHVLLRADRAVYRAGDRIRLQVYSTKQAGTVYVDLVKEGQTIGTHDLEIVNGRAELDLPASPEMTGTVDINAYLFCHDSEAISDHRLIFVQPADELRIQTALDQPVYKPGGEARIGFQVRNNRGEGVQAALGVEIIDQAVLALAEKRPGFAKVFFYLEQEAMKPRYEIHSVTLAEAISSEAHEESSRQDRAARVLFAATELKGGNNSQAEFGRTAPQSKYPEYAARYQAQLRTEIDSVASAPYKNEGDETCDQAVLTARLREAALRDPWGNSLRVEDRNPGTRTFAVRSAGPDGQFDTPDDLVQYREDRYCTEPGLWGHSGSIDLRIERNGLLDGLAEIAGTVRDRSDAAIRGASIELFDIATGKEYNLVSGPDGRFAWAALHPAQFQMQVSSPGFERAARRFSLKEGDRAIVSVILDVGAVTEAVTVEAAPASAINTEMAVVGRARRSLSESKNAPAVSRAATLDTHLRTWFPEALYVAPEIITDEHGRASIIVPIADNITTWRMAMLASTKQGALGSATSSLKVFQDFFTELDLPVTLTPGDQVSLPVAVYNYSGSRGQVHLKLQEDDWFSLFDDQPVKALAAESGRVTGSQFTIRAQRIGKFKLTLRAAMDGPAKRADIVVREIEVVPNGREQALAFNGRLEGSAEHLIAFPPDALPDADKIFVRLYPSPMSQVVEGMDAILQMPFGCFEQTSSATYPNVLALDYMKRIKKLTPEIHAKAEGFIATGYQRLLTFEVPGGGFSWFGQAPANKILTSYGLMEFGDMSKVHEIDPKIIQRTQQWLAGRQQPDGSWKPDVGFINEGATNRYNTDLLRITSYIAWALESTGYQGPEIDRAREFIRRTMNRKADAYSLAVLANFAVDHRSDRDLTDRAIQQLLGARTEKDDQAWWTADETGLYGRGESAAIETTGLAAQVLLKSGEAPDIARKALNYIAARKDAAGTWGTTQATIMTLRALLLSTEKGAADTRGTVQISLNGKPAESFTLTPENSDLFQQFVLKGADLKQSNDVALHFNGKGSVAYQVIGQYFVPWSSKASEEPLSIDVKYDRTRLAQGDVISAVAAIKNHMPKTANMVMVDLGIPPGFDLLSEDLDDYRTKSARRKSGRLEKFNLTATQAILYFDSIAAGDTVSLRYRLRAKYPIRGRTFRSRVYEYYDPEVNSVARPIELEVRER